MCRLLSIGLLSLASLATPLAFRSSVHEEEPKSAKWETMALQDEEFSILTPVQPSVLVQSGRYTLSNGGETVLSYRAYSGYADGFIFVVESFKATRPQRLLKDIDTIVGKLGRDRLGPLENANFAGFAAKKYALGRNNFAGNVYVLVAQLHIYTVIVAARSQDHPSVNRFLSSFTLRDLKNTQGTVLPKREDDAVTNVPYPGSLVSAKEATRKPIVVWKPEPMYTESARVNQRAGKVVLMSTFTSSGQVIISAVIKGLKDGLTEQAIEAAKNIKFLPAEKDGQPASMTLQLEYNFNLY